MSMRSAAEDSYGKKLDRMGLTVSTASTGAKGVGDAYPQADGTQGNAQGSRAEGYATEKENEETLERKAPKSLRLDRKPFAKGGRVAKKGTTVNVIVAPQSKPDMPPMPPPMPPAPPPGAVPPPGIGGPGAGPDGPPPMMRARGGKVPMQAGAGSGLGRLEKMKEYGSRAKPGAAAKAGTM